MLFDHVIDELTSAMPAGLHLSVQIVMTWCFELSLAEATMYWKSCPSKFGADNEMWVGVTEKLTASSFDFPKYWSAKEPSTWRAKASYTWATMGANATRPTQARKNSHNGTPLGESTQSCATSTERIARAKLPFISSMAARFKRPPAWKETSTCAEHSPNAMSGRGHLHVHSESRYKVKARPDSRLVAIPLNDAKMSHDAWRGMGSRSPPRSGRQNAHRVMQTRSAIVDPDVCGMQRS